MHRWINAQVQRLPDFVQKAGISMVLRFGGILLQFVSSVLAARLLGVEAFGAFTYAFVWTALIGILLALGLGQLSIREIPGYLARGEMSELVGLLATIVVTMLVTGVLTAIGLAALQRSGILALEPGWGPVTAVTIIQGLVIVLMGLLNGFQRIVTSQVLGSITSQTLYLAVLIAVTVAGISITPRDLFDIYFVTALPAAILMVIALTRALRHSEVSIVRPSLTLRPWFIASIPMLLTGYAGLLQSNLDILMVGSLLGDYETGLYRAAARGAALVTIAHTVSVQVLGPMLSRALAQKREHDAQTLLSYGALMSAAAGGIVFLVLYLESEFYLGLFGKEFVAGTHALHILLFGQIASFMTGAVGILLILLHRERLVLLVNVIGIGMNFTLNALLIPRIGIEGAAIATAISLAFVNSTLLAVVFYQKRFDPTLLALARRAWRKP